METEWWECFVTSCKTALSRFWTYIKAKIESVTLNTVTISGDLTVDTSTFKVDSTSNRVGVATASPEDSLHIGAGGLLVTGTAYGGDGAHFDFFSSRARFFGYNYTGGVYRDVVVNDAIYVKGAGNVGIGVQAPSTALDINGTISFDANSGTWDGATITGAQNFSGDIAITGSVLANGNPKVQAYKTSDQNSPTGYTYTKVTFESEEYDTTSSFASSTFTAPFACTIDVKFSLFISGTNGSHIFAIYKNGSPWKRMSKYVLDGNLASGSVIVKCAQGDTLDLYIYPTTVINLLASQSDSWITFTAIP